MEAFETLPSAAEGTKENDLRRLGLSSSEIIANLKEMWPATPGHNDDGIVAMINLLRHMYASLSPELWQKVQTIEATNPILEYAWQKLPLQVERRCAATKSIFLRMGKQAPATNSLYDLYRRSIMQEFWTLGGVARWYGSWEYSRKRGTTDEWTRSVQEPNNHKNTWFSIKDHTLPKEAHPQLQGCWTHKDSEKCIVFLRPEFLRFRLYSAATPESPGYDQLHHITVDCVDPDFTTKDTSPIFTKVRYVLLAVIKEQNKEDHFDRLHLYDEKGSILILPDGITGIAEFRRPGWSFGPGGEKGRYELIYVKDQESKKIAPGISKKRPSSGNGLSSDSSQQKRVRLSSPISEALDMSRPAKGLTFHELEGALSGSRKEVLDLKQKLDTARSERDGAYKKIDEKNKELVMMHEQAAVTCKERDDVSKQVVELGKQLDSMREERDCLGLELTAARKDIEFSRKQRAEAFKECDDLNDQLAQRLSELTSARTGRGAM